MRSSIRWFASCFVSALSLALCVACGTQEPAENDATFAARFAASADSCLAGQISDPSDLTIVDLAINAATRRLIISYANLSCGIGMNPTATFTLRVYSPRYPSGYTLPFRLHIPNRKFLMTETVDLGRLGIPSGTSKIHAVIDSGSNISELSERNNWYTESLSYLPVPAPGVPSNAPDLVVESLSLVPAKPGYGVLKVKNRGFSIGAGKSFRARWIVNGAIPLGYPFDRMLLVPAPGSSTNIEFAFKSIPELSSASSGKFSIELDPDSVIPELSEINNSIKVYLNLTAPLPTPSPTTPPAPPPTPLPSPSPTTPPAPPPTPLPTPSPTTPPAPSPAPTPPPPV